MPNVGPMEIIIVLVIGLLVLGPKRLPEMGKSIGRGMREFKNALTMGDDDDDEVIEPKAADSAKS
jgi:sec-independent protein translocase protein TatA